MNRKHVCVGLGLLLIITWGCQTAQAPREKDKQANAYIEQAQAYEGQGNLVEALEQYKLAQTIEPDEPVITDSINRVEKELERLAEAHYQAGLRFRDKGRWDLAKKEFLKTLRYRPDHEKAAAMLQQRQPAGEEKFITHQIATGESISKLALKYYGDYKKYHHIANFNKLSDATQVRVGQRIMIPVIDGVTIDDLNRISTGSSAPSPQPSLVKGEYTIHQIKPGESLSKIAKIYYGDVKLFHVIADYNGIADPTSVKVGQKVKVPRLSEVTAPAPEKPYLLEDTEQAPYSPETAQPEAVAEAPEPPAEASEAPLPEASEPVDQVAEYRETGIALFNEKKYDDAILELQKVLSASPDDAAAIDYISRSYVDLGKGHLAANRINEAKTAFTTALDYDDNCQDCRDLLAQCRTVEAETLRTKGEQQFKNNEFDKAVLTLERAVALNPDDTAATDLLFQTHFQKALILFNKQDYLAAKTDFVKAMAIKPDCSDCQGYIEECMSAFKEFHYNEGIVFFGQEKLKQAIASWEKVTSVDPDYKDVQQNLKKATLLNDRLERIKKSSTD
jgi:tetratricopeptide (TPR) repeat protein